MNKNPFDPLILKNISLLSFRARWVVEGLFSGLHKSPYHGSSIEFAEHKEYTPGDEVKNIDWRVYARLDKYYIRQFEKESNLRAYLMLDKTASMGYRGKGVSKFEYAITLTATLTYIFLMQGDAVGLGLASNNLSHFVPPRSNFSHLNVITDILEKTRPEGFTDLPASLEGLAEKLKGRGIIIVISDLLSQDLKHLLRSLRELRHRKYEVIIFHILDSDELNFPFQNYANFRGMEVEGETLIEPGLIRSFYLDELHSFLDETERGCLSSEIDYFLINTSTPLDISLNKYLSRRTRNKA